jgi:hypothetical protein
MRCETRISDIPLLQAAAPLIYEALEEPSHRALIEIPIP